MSEPQIRIPVVGERVIFIRGQGERSGCEAMVLAHEGFELKVHFFNGAEAGREGIATGGGVRVIAQPDPEPIRGVRWERMVDAGIKSGMTREASESHADKYAVRIAPKLTAEDAAEEYSTALARELGLRPSSSTGG